RRHPGPHGNVRQIVREELHLPLDDRAAALRSDLKQAGVMGRGKTGDLAVTVEALRVVDGLEALDDFLTVARLDRAELADSGAGQADARHQWMPVEVELSDRRPHGV